MHRPGIPNVEFGDAICYSGYRDGQNPGTQDYPTEEQVAEDLKILAPHWRYLRLYDCSEHAHIVMRVIEREGLDFRVLLGAEKRAEKSNPDCPWDATFDDETLAANRAHNEAEIDRAIALARKYGDRVMGVSIGNEAAVEWTDHLVGVERLVESAQRLKEAIDQPVTFCDNYVPWLETLAPLVDVVDFLSIHTYPVWEYQSIENALDYTKSNFDEVAARWPDKPIVITEAGWTTVSNGRGIESWNASQELQAIYYEQLMEWTRGQQILTFVFEAFDEPWKGSPDPAEPEKHWGLFTVDRRPKQVMRDLYPGLVKR